jgi:hypothetical protein
MITEQPRERRLIEGQWVSLRCRHSPVPLARSLCEPLRFLAHFAVDNPCKELTAKNAKDAKIRKELN